MKKKKTEIFLIFLLKGKLKKNKKTRDKQCANKKGTHTTHTIKQSTARLRQTTSLNVIMVKVYATLAQTN